jgi:hypothetical protein
MKKYFNGLINIELDFYNETTHQVRTIRVAFRKEKMPAFSAILRRYFYVY